MRTLGLNFDAHGGIFQFWGQDEYYDPRHLIDAFGNAPGEWLAFEFALVDPVEYYLARYIRLYDHLTDEEYLSRFAHTALKRLSDR